ncbi:pyocin knob domain-containing protein [Paracoccus bogoriensis]|uniref:pyocin knob domain-containing protein n=1 Tax=Paracoccus bogoriensis TaxID=242065 RepID=UPI001CA53D30|nr:pyocin knob domain-containing protein [Paracoccus bogoriensis]MBW7057318.1 pyocin knob domain-containing protein [Paracoccus bogoriensis]
MNTPVYSLPVSGTAPNQLASKSAHDAEINRVITELNATLRADIDPRSTPTYASRAAAEAAASGLPASVTQILVREGTALVVRSRTATADDPLYATAPRWGVVNRQDTRALLANMSLPVGAVDGTGDAITAEIPAALVLLGQGDVADGQEFVFVPAAANMAQNPTIRIDRPAAGSASAVTGTARGVRGGDGEAWPARGFVAGRPYVLRRVGSLYRVVRGDVTRTEHGRLLTAIRLGAVIPLTGIGGSGDAITATIDPAFIDAGVTSLGSASEVEYIPIATNTAGNPTISIGGSTFQIRRADGSAWGAGRFVVGRVYKMRRFGSQLRVIAGDVQGWEIDAQLATLARKLVTISSANTAQERNANNWTLVPGSYRFADLSIGNAPSGLGSPVTGEVQVEQSVTGVWQTWRDQSGRRFERRRVDGEWKPWIELARETRVAALEVVVNNKANQSDLAAAGLAIGQLQAVTAMSGPVLNQVGPDLPVLPTWVTPEMSVTWRCWDSPQARMRKFDTWVRLPAPAEPPVPLAQSWDVYDARDGQSIAIVLRSIPDENPAIIGVDRRVGGSERPWVALPDALPGAYLVGGLPAGPHQVTIRHRNFVGGGEGDLDRDVVVSANDITADLNGSGLLFNVRPAKWQNLVQDMSIGTRGLSLSGGVARPTHANQQIRARYRDYFTTGQFMRATILGLDSVAHPNGVDGVGLGLNSSGSAALRAMLRRTGVTLQAIEANGTRRSLASFSQTWGYPVVLEIRRPAGGSVIQVLVGGSIVLSLDLAGDPAAALSGGAPEIYAFVTAGGTPSHTQITNIQMGHA